MFHVAARLFWLIAAPGNLAAWLVIGGAFAGLTGRRRVAGRLSAAAAGVLIVFGLMPAGSWLARPLENAYPRPDPLPAHIDGVVVLGGGLDPGILRSRGAPSPAGGIFRPVSAFALLRHYPNAKLVFSGGFGGLGERRYAEADAAAIVLDQLGFDKSRLILERRSRDTWENLVYSKALVRPKPGAVWLLATSAVHMPRAMGIARAVGWPMLAYPTDYITSPRGGGEWLNAGRNLEISNAVLHEYAGLSVYRLTGRTSAVLRPAPKQP